ncbi:helix-turn-helix domain-containing protein [Streptomyces fagopyri]|uniref:helix-turn-helix domain-containing protein n=1 Tax=Streptomyces fagopyri TaxID=2662397 RepID=UPI0036CB8D0E
MAGDEFAGLLRELKERSGLSYAALAKRLHVSTSTLHRYVNGDAVPTDYAPVERLARACRATPDELVELHRRWVLADVLRGRRGAAAGTLPGAAADADEDGDEYENGDERRPGHGGADGAGDGDGDDGDAGGAVSGPASAVRDVAAEAGPGALPESGRAAGRRAGPEAVTRAPVRRKRRAVALAAAGAVVVAAVASTALVVHLGSGGRDDDAKGHAAAVGVPPGARPRADSTPTGARRGSASPSASRAGGPGASASSAGGAVERHAAGGKGAAGDGPAGDGAAAPAVVVDPYKWDGPCDQHYLVNRRTAEMPPPPNEADARRWVAALGGVAGGRQMLALTVQGTGKATVVVEGLHVRVLEKNAPLAWNDYAMGVGCGGGVETRSFTVDLDAGRPVTAPEAGQRDFPYKVSESDPEVFYVFADAQAHDVSWYLELDWSSGSKSGTVRVDDRGKPFRTSGSVGRPAYDYPLGGSEWQPAAPPG